MRERTRWRDGLRKQLERAWSEPYALTPAQLLDVELALYLAWYAAPGATTDVVPALLSGYGVGPNEAQMVRTAVGAARHLIPTFKSPHEWRRALAAYAQVPSRWRGFDVPGNGTFEERQPATLSDRWLVYGGALSKSPGHRREAIDAAQSGPHVIQMRQSQFRVELPELAAPPV